MKVCICGGGNLGHVVTGFVSARTNYEVRLLTRQPERWDKSIIIRRPDNWPLIGTPECITNLPEEAVAGADVIVLCLPGFSIREVLLQIKDSLKPDAIVGSVVSSTGFFFEAMDILPPSQPLFGLQRVPFISRTAEYGHMATIMGYKDSLAVAVEQTWRGEEIRHLCELLFNTPTKLLGSHYEASLSNSNPLLHPARLYSLWKDWHEGMVYNRIPLFYEEWDEAASQLYISMDDELHVLLEALHVRKEAIPSVLEYYESTDAASLARKLSTIAAFKGIEAPMKMSEKGFVPDFQSRYFTEDFPCGLAIVRRLAREKQLVLPVVERLCQWGMEKIGIQA
jgi:hypothetical protein